MNKTLDINIANQIFHIDESAYNILKKYLDDIKLYLTEEESRDEIIQDIESRIAELFIERMISDKQVIGDNDVYEVIKIMGQPEDYNLSDTENQKTYKGSKPEKKLFRDRESAYISGLSAGIAHYLNVEVIWIRVLWILLTIFSTGWLILVYIILWILVPEAKTTADKLSMKGEPINLSNIEKKIKEGYDNVSDKIKGVDVKKHSKNAQSNISGFFSQLEKFLKAFGSILLKIIGIFLIIISGIGLLALILSALGVGGIGLFSNADFHEFVRIDGFLGNSIVPAWLIIISAFISVIIPVLFVFIFSLKILFSNIKRPNATFIITSVSIWVLSVATLIFSGINAESRNKVKGEFVQTEPLKLKPSDTLFLAMKGNLNYTNTPYRHNNSFVTFDNENNKVLYDSDVDVKFHSISDDEAYIRISKWSYDFDEEQARTQSQTIEYEFSVNENNLNLNAYMIAPLDLKYNSKGVDIDIYLPDNIYIKINENAEYFLKNRFKDNDIDDQFNKIYLIDKSELICSNCEQTEEELKIIDNKDNLSNK